MVEPSAFLLKACITNILRLRSSYKACCLGSHRSRIPDIHAGDLFLSFHMEKRFLSLVVPYGDTSSSSAVARLL